ncbi:MAG: hypothetical protein ABI855_14080 [Bacteroidota bacterium]
MKNKAILIVLLSLPGIYSCAGNKPQDNDKHKKKEKEVKEQTIAPSETQNSGAKFIAAGCNPALWDRVYNPSRLEIIDSCISVTGVITESHAEDDGDQHLLLKLDAGQENLLNKRNLKKKSDELVLEVICANNVKLKKVKKACKGYVNNVEIHPVGMHVKVTGSYVIDSHNGWAEIHPVTKMDIIK